ncbi:MAG: hypothetical protein ACREV4_13755 [Gammaproteobacteria bacterium]
MDGFDRELQYCLETWTAIGWKHPIFFTFLDDETSATNVNSTDFVLEVYDVAVKHLAPSVPAAPTALDAVSVSTSSIQLSWADDVTNELGYKIERKVSRGTYAQIATVGADVTSYPDTGVKGHAVFPSCGHRKFPTPRSMSEEFLRDKTPIVGAVELVGERPESVGSLWATRMLSIGCPHDPKGSGRSAGLVHKSIAHHSA